MTAINLRRCTCGERLHVCRIHGSAGAILTEGRLLRCVSDECRKAYILEDDVCLLEICGNCYELLEECHCDQRREREGAVPKAFAPEMFGLYRVFYWSTRQKGDVTEPYGQDDYSDKAAAEGLRDKLMRSKDIYKIEIWGQLETWLERHNPCRGVPRKSSTFEGARVASK